MDRVRVVTAPLPSPAPILTPITGSSKRQQSNDSKLSRYLKAPIRAFTRFKEFYVRSLVRCADGGFGRGVGSYPVIPRGYSVQSMRSDSSREDFSELVRAVSQRKHRDLNFTGSTPGTPVVVPRSQSVAVGRIDEDKPMELDGDVNLDVLYLRSKSAVPIIRMEEILLVSQNTTNLRVEGRNE